MAFPQVANTSTGVTAADTSHAITLPTGIVAGNLLMVFFATDGDNTITNWGGFTELFNDSSGTAASLSVGYKTAVGEDTLTITTSSSEEGSYVCFRITGHSTSQVPEVSASATLSSQNPDPDSLTPTGGAKDYLWIAVEGNDHLDTTSAWPLPDNNLEACGGGSGSCNIGVCSDELNQASLDPGTFTLDSAEQWVACTVAVHPIDAEQDELVANNILSGTPVLGTPSVGVIHNLVANNLLSGTPVVASPTIGQKHNLTAENITSGAPVLGTPTVTEIHVLSANDIVSGTPVLGTPTVGIIHNLTANNLLSGTPALESPDIGQIHGLTANNIVSQSPVLGTPVLAEEGSDDLTANNILSGTPVLGTPTLGQVHGLTANNILSGTPALGTPTLGVIHNLTANNILSGTPVLAQPTIGQIHGLTANNISTANPVLGTPTLSEPGIDNLTANNILAQNPILGSPTLSLLTAVSEIEKGHAYRKIRPVRRILRTDEDEEIMQIVEHILTSGILE